jgi:hypothetical protein
MQYKSLIFSIIIIIIRIAEVKGLMNKHQIDALETKSREKISLFQAIVTDYATEMADLRDQLYDIMTMVEEQERKLDE